MSRFSILLILLALICTACAPAAAQTSSSAHTSPPQTTTPTTPAPRATLTETPTAPPQTATPLPSPTHTPSPSPTQAFSAWELVYDPTGSDRTVADVRWTADGRSLEYALSPINGGYLLDWYSYSLSAHQSQSISPTHGFAELWQKVGLGFPRTVDPFSETLGFVSPEFDKAIYPNIGFPEVNDNPNYIFVVFAGGQERQLVLGPTIGGQVGRAEWLDYGTRVVFDYRYEGRLVLYLATLLTRHTVTLYELGGGDVDWQVSPDWNYLLVPQSGQSVLLPLRGLGTLPAPEGMVQPEWSRDSKKIYYWSSSENRILSYTLADQAVQAVLMRRDLENASPLAPVYGMPFTASPDGTRFAFCWENWIWIVALANGGR